MLGMQSMPGACHRVFIRRAYIDATGRICKIPLQLDALGFGS